MQLKYLQYKQIDFLRLFRLTRSLGIIKRKRKMPNQYDNQAYIASSCSKLFKSFLTGLFENCSIQSARGTSAYLICQREDCIEALRFVKTHERLIMASGYPFDVLSNISNIEEFNSDIISIGISPYTIIVRVFAANFNNSRHSAIASITGVNCNRPREEFYTAAKECVRFKEVWDANIDGIVEFVEQNRDVIERSEEAGSSPDIASPFVTENFEETEVADSDATLQEREDLLESIEQVRRTRRTRSQTLFDEALARRMNNE
jgi:hypothetical protein